jgi:hypothetical protein
MKAKDKARESYKTIKSIMIMNEKADLISVMKKQYEQALSEQLDEVVKIIKDMDFESIADKKEVWIDKYKLISNIEKLKEVK